MNDELERLKATLDPILTSYVVAKADKVRSQIAAREVGWQVLKLRAKIVVLRVVQWNQKRSQVDPIWQIAVPLTLAALLALLVLLPVFYATSSIGVALFVYLLCAVGFVLGFLLLNVKQLVSSVEGLQELQSRLVQKKSLHRERTIELLQTKNKFSRVKQEKGLLERRISQIKTSVRYRNQQRINLLLSQPWRQLRGIGWETFLGELLECQGFSVEFTKTTGDQGVDLIARKQNISIAIQAKGYSGNVGNAAVQQAYTGKAIYGCTHCAVMTNSEFTPSAIEAARRTGCILVAGSDIQNLANGSLAGFP